MAQTQQQLEPPRFVTMKLFYSGTPNLEQLEDEDKNIFGNCRWVQELCVSDDYLYVRSPLLIFVVYHSDLWLMSNIIVFIIRMINVGELMEYKRIFSVSAFGREVIYSSNSSDRWRFLGFFSRKQRKSLWPVWFGTNYIGFINSFIKLHIAIENQLTEQNGLSR